MRVFVDLIENLTSMMRFIVGAIALCGLVFGLLTTFGASYVAPKIAADYGERAERFGEKAINEARDARRERELAKDGWGYGAAGNDHHRSRDRDEDPKGGWGDTTG